MQHTTVSAARGSILSAQLNLVRIFQEDQQLKAIVEVSDAPQFHFYPPMGFTIESFSKARTKYHVRLLANTQYFENQSNTARI